MMCKIALVLCLTGIINVETVKVSAAVKVSATVKASEFDQQEENPIRGVINTLKQIQNTLIKEGKTALEAHDKAMCLCETLGADMKMNLVQLEAKKPMVESVIKEDIALTETLEEDITEAKNQYTKDEESLENDNIIIIKKRRVWTKEEIEKKEQVDAVAQIVYAIEHGGQEALLQKPNATTPAFLQTPQMKRAVSFLYQLAESADMNPRDREVLTNFLSQDVSPMVQPAETAVKPTEKKMIPGDCKSTQFGCCDSTQWPHVMCKDKDCNSCPEPGATCNADDTTYGCCDYEPVPKIDSAGRNCMTSDVCFMLQCPAEIECSDGKPMRQIGKYCCQCPDGKIELSSGTQELVGMLKEMQRTFQEEFEKLIDGKSEYTYVYIVKTTATKKEEEVLQEQIDTKSVKQGETKLETTQKKAEKDAIERELSEEELAFREMSKQCIAQKESYEKLKKEREEELLAVMQTIKVLDEDEALDLFKKTLPTTTGESFLQLKATAKNIRLKALRALQARRRHGKYHRDPRVGLIENALQSGKDYFAHVIKAIDDLIGTMNKEQTDETAKMEDGREKLEKNNAAIEELNKTISSMQADIDATQSLVNGLAGEIQQLEEDLKKKAEEKKQLSDLRADENAQFITNMKDNTDAQVLLEKARTHMNKFYNPTVVVDPPVSAGSTFLQIHAKANEEAKKDARGQDVIDMLGNFIRDLKNQKTAMTDLEQEQLTEYEADIKRIDREIGEKRDSLETKENEKSEQEGLLSDAVEKQNGNIQERDNLLEIKAGLHEEFDFIIENYEARKAARAVEIEGLERAKGELSGADMSTR